MKITKESIAKAEQVLIDNGIEVDEAKTVLEAVGYTLMDVSLYDEEDCALTSEYEDDILWSEVDVGDNADIPVTRDMIRFWWQHHERSFRESLTEIGNEMLANIDWKAVKREMEERNA